MIIYVQGRAYYESVGMPGQLIRLVSYTDIRVSVFKLLPGNKTGSLELK
ncbi:hypothetical protein JMN32_14870 [Fulvivirga sp. 29W222]|uniref:Uncharacterized protein n=1 Tax=Fulvivirga marina TaxID=2494733 RepID=A0A937FZ09_9BACT|nr:hypothetical protein [Fulvivirga marina]MBL6447598.1 hypothetical protein [Fulvivirga marina]